MKRSFKTISIVLFACILITGEISCGKIIPAVSKQLSKTKVVAKSKPGLQASADATKSAISKSPNTSKAAKGTANSKAAQASKAASRFTPQLLAAANRARLVAESCKASSVQTEQVVAQVSDPLHKLMLLRQVDQINARFERLDAKLSNEDLSESEYDWIALQMEEVALYNKQIEQRALEYG